ncbi:MAG: RloB family protein [Parabacteroides sp.]|nr:RloB family protein [Parabacteroides sp.]MDY6006334.1 RloB domain-containing protein [Parabacteroides sp.]
MARKTATIQKNQERAVIIGAGITERWYFSHMQSLYDLKVKIRPRYFGNESIFTLEKLIKQVLDNEGLAIVVFDTDVSTWNESENKKLSALRQKYSKHKRVILCESMPSIEFWFLIHFINTNRFFGTSKSVIAELVKFIPKFDKNESFLSNKKWVDDMCQDGRLINACRRAKQLGSEGESYSNLWKAFAYLGI